MFLTGVKSNILPVQGKKDAFIFLADRWTPENPIDGKYIWLPVKFKDDRILLEWPNCRYQIHSFRIYYGVTVEFFVFDSNGLIDSIIQKRRG